MNLFELNNKSGGLAQKAYTDLKAMILNHQLIPGNIFNESQLQEALGIGRTPVREAVQQLAKENLIVVHPRRGLEVSKISPKRIHDIFQVRSMLEPIILEKNFDKIDVGWLSNLHEKFLSYINIELSAENTIIISNLDNEFHMGIANSAGNHYITELMSSFQDYLTLFRAYSKIDYIRFAPSNMEHIQIIESILKKDVEKACKDLAHHLEKSYEESINIVMHMPI